MKKVWIAGIMGGAVDCNIDYVASPAINIEKMEAEGISGFDFKLPKSIVGNLYNSDDIELKIDMDIEPETTTIYLADTSSLVSGDFYWIKNEQVVVTVIDSTTISIARGRNGTFINRYIRSNNSFYYLRKYPKSLIGQRVFLYQDTELLSIGLIKEQPKFNGTVLEFSCSNAIDCLDTDFTIPPNSSLIYRGWYDFIIYSTLTLALNYKYLERFSFFADYYIGEVPPILDFIDFPDAWSLVGGEFQTIIKMENIPSILDFINIHSKINGAVFTWDASLQKYAVIQISDTSSLDTVASLNISDYLKINDSYKSELYTGIAQISVKTENGVINLNSINVMQFAKDSRLDIDISNYQDVSIAGIKNTLFYYNRLFSVVYSKLTIPTHYKKYYDFKEGHFYDFNDIDKFFTFQNISNRAFCLKKDEGEITFLITRTLIKNPIAPALNGKMTATNIFTHDDHIRNFLDCSCSEVEDAKIARYDYPFFAVDDFVIFIDETGARTSCKITAISGKSMKLDTSFTAGTKGFLTYDKATVVNTRQQIFFFLDNNRW